MNQYPGGRSNGCELGLFSVLLLLFVLIPQQGWPDPAKDTQSDEGFTGDITVGAGGVGLDNDSFKFGEYSGIEKGDGFFVGDADVAYNRKSYYMDFIGENIGLENRGIYLELGKRGDYSFFAEFDQTPHLLSNNSLTVLSGAGTNLLTLPSGFGRGLTTSAMTISERSAVELQIDGRDQATFGFSKSFGENEVNVSYMREDKDGIKSMGVPFGTGANSKSVIVPEVFDQDTNELKFTLAHNGEQGQIQLQYFVSLYDNRIESISVDSPFTGHASIGNRAEVSRPPDNRYHKVNLSGGWNIGETTRISGIVEYGLMLQDEQLLPYGTIAHTSPLPRTNADAKIHTTHLNLNVSSRPLPKLGLNGKYRHYQTINDMQKTLIIPLSLDASSANDSSTQSHFNFPFAYAQDNLQADATYQVYKGTTLKLGYEADMWNRSFREAELTFENIFKAGLRTRYFSFATMNFDFSYGNKRQDKNDMDFIFRERHSPNCIAGGCGIGFDSLPNLQRFDVNNRERTKFGANINFMPIGKTTFGVNYNLKEDDYPDDRKGVEYSRNQNATVDVNYSVSDATSFYAFYTYDRQDVEQAGREFNSIGGSANDPTRDFWLDENTASHTVGIGSQGTLFRNKLSLNAEYSYTQSITDITFASAGNAVVADPAPMPDLVNKRHRFDLKGDYRINSHLSVGAKYLLDVYNDSDFATDAISQASTAIGDVLLLSGSESDFAAHLGMVFLTYKLGE